MNYVENTFVALADAGQDRLWERHRALEWQDAERSRELERLCKELSHCLYCGKNLSDNSVVLHPGVCSNRHCRKKRASGVPPPEIEPRKIRRGGRWGHTRSVQ